MQVRTLILGAAAALAATTALAPALAQAHDYRPYREAYGYGVRYDVRDHDRYDRFRDRRWEERREEQARRYWAHRRWEERRERYYGWR